jgi:VWFA-related protein
MKRSYFNAELLLVGYQPFLINCLVFIGLLYSAAYAQSVSACQNFPSPGELLSKLNDNASVSYNDIFASELIEQMKTLSQLKLKAESEKNQASDKNPKKADSNTEKKDEKKYAGQITSTQKELEQTKKNVAEKLCSLLATNGLPIEKLVSPSGFVAFLYLINEVFTQQDRIRLFQPILTAYKKGLVIGSEPLAGYIDKTLLSAGRPQIFGTLAYIKDGFITIAPLQNPAQVDLLRKDFGLVPLHDYERRLQRIYSLPVIRALENLKPITEATESYPSLRDNDGSASAINGEKPDNNPSNNAVNATALLEDNQKPIVINTAFVRVDVTVSSKSALPTLELDKQDFRLFDNGKQVAVDYFARVDAPFDIVLLIDLSASTRNKLGLIRKSVKRFIELKRPNDRLAIVGFNDQQIVFSNFESDREKLFEGAKKIEGFGASFVWDSIDFSMKLFNQQDPNRRRAIVLMSDGIDNNLQFKAQVGSKLNFSELVEKVVNENIIIYPIYLDTEKDFKTIKATQDAARRTLEYLAEMSGGNFYIADKLEQVTEIYEKVQSDLGRIYSIGFYVEGESTNSSKWHNIRVELVNHPELQLKYRKGFLAK